MKKFLLATLALTLTLTVVSLTGCSSTSSSGTATSSIPAEDIAVSVGVAAKNALTIDNSILGVVTGAGVRSSGIKVNEVEGLAYADGWWSGTSSYAYTYTSEGTTTVYTYSYAYNFKVWNAAGTELTTLAALRGVEEESGLSKIWTYSTFTYSMGDSTYTSSYGNSKDDPIKFEGLGTSTPTLSGTMKYAGTYLTTTYSMTFTYDALGMTASGYPNGSITYSVAEGGATTASGGITYNGTNICTVTVTSGGVTSTFTCNLDTGAVTAAGSR
ncbi:MAG: hypothetical protein WC529_02315 [Candidatus Margulisiibacteriota bacterium]